MVSTEGGVEIEQVAEETPEKIIKEWVEPGMGLQPNQARRLAFALGLEGDAFKKAVKFIMALYKCYDETDANLVEINPLVRTPDVEIFALDAKFTFDDNGMFRQKKYAELRSLNSAYFFWRNMPLFTFDDNGMFRQKKYAELRDLS